MRGSARIATYIGRTLMVVGFLLMVLAWNGAANFDYIQGQFPYLMSSTIPGLALVIVGAGLEYIQAVRMFTARRAKQMAELNVAVVRLVGFVRDNGGLPRADDEVARVPVAAGAVAASAVAGGDTVALRGAGEDMVIAGRSSFHRADCHLVAGRDDMAPLTRLEAEAKDLSGCRVCKP